MSASSYKCDCCDFSTAYKQHLRKHTETKHEGVRYSCSRCEYQATLKQNLVRHGKTKHGTTSFKYTCDFCDHRATFSYEIALHIKSDHYGVEYECESSRWNLSHTCHIFAKNYPLVSKSISLLPLFVKKLF